MRRNAARLCTAGISHLHGPTTVPLLDRHIFGQLAENAKRHPESLFVTFSEQRVQKTYAAFSKDVDEVAAGLLALGYEQGDRVGVWLPNYYEWILTQFACHRIGLILVNINPAYRSTELAHALHSVGCKGLVVTDRFKTSDYAGLLNTVLPDLANQSRRGRVSCEEIPSLEHVFSINSARLDGVPRLDDIRVAVTPRAAASLEAATGRISPHDAANIQFTSGTTGLPKPATLTHHNILNNGYLVGKGLSYSMEDSVCVPVPLYHCFGTVLATLAVLTNGGSLVFPSPGFDAAETLRAVSEMKCTSLYGVPTMFIQVLQEAEVNPSKYDFSTLRKGIMAGSNCPPEVMSRVQSLLGMVDVVNCYGMTETSPVSFQTPSDAPKHLKCETVGKVHGHLECKVVDGNDDIVQRGMVGELLTKGYSVMKGYFNMPKETAKSITEDGFMRTGDLAVVDNDGYCRIVGRKKDMIIRGGENIYPAEVEAFLHGHEDISDVAVVGLPHPVYGEQVGAFIIPRPGRTIDAASVKAFCFDKIAHFKTPTVVVCLEAFPLTATGKVRKNALRDEYVEG
ncbi:putative acyl-CoA synthetase YngI [Diplonema papillatum]|nr:putative acyl-CoA synthetase YngI [Diplonema papillatum]